MPSHHPAPGFSWIVLAAILAAGGCGTRKTPTESSSPPDPAATFARVQAQIFTPSCALSGCHAGPSPVRGMDLSAGRAFGQVVGVPSVESTRVRISPGDVAGSYLVSKVLGDSSIAGGRMPFGGPYLPPDKLTLLADWVRRGAPND